MSKSSSPSRSGKATKRKYRKPHPDFPLTPHPTGRWCKKVKGKFYFFGRIEGDENGDAALAYWLKEKDNAFAGRPLGTKDSDSGLTVAELCNHFLTFKQQLRDADELAKSTFDRYYSACEFLVQRFGKQRAVEGLRPNDFQNLRAAMAKRWGAVALANEIQMVRSIFRYGYEAELLDKPIRFGPGFKKPSAKTIRKTRTVNGPQMFTPEQLHKLLEHSTTNMRAMILLAINAGLGNTDLAAMPLSAVDGDGKWLNYARAKTGIMRRIPLWQETAEAIRNVIAERCNPADVADNGLLFIGRRGLNYIGKTSKSYRVTQEFERVAQWAGVTGRTFYDCRRTFQTIGEGANDLAAVQAIMGHAAGNSDMSAVYRQTVSDDRLQAVVHHVHSWLFESAGDDSKADAEQRRFKVVG